MCSELFWIPFLKQRKRKLPNRLRSLLATFACQFCKWQFHFKRMLSICVSLMSYDKFASLVNAER
ncbi:hypothetical protein GQ37_002525 [Janthinobacterium sp. BJB1]|nr:hypothetical protein CSQ90_12125 [Janthinobacterium sp. BJB303]PHV40498.1 hypothetical protein CSQ95_02570 [Janthinobacterium sp. BJB304]PJD00496.1 hypothetical protein GQ37_002525 [Janthinobacterium sp. BJB1]